jgi:two-component sensor histidine kinase
LSGSQDSAKKDQTPLENEFIFNIKKAREIIDGKKSLPYSLKALEIAKEIGDGNKVGQSYNQISFDYEVIGDLKIALQYVLQASKIYETNGNKKQCGVAYNRIGTIYFKQGNTKLAIYYIKMAIEVHKQINALMAIGEDYNNLGEIYRMSKENELAMMNFQKAYAIFSKAKDTLRLAYAAGNIGLVFAAQKQKDSANYYISKSTLTLKKNGDFYPITVYLIESANIYFNQGNTKEALREAKEALAISEDQNLKEQIRDASKLLSQIYVKLGDYKNAHSSLQQYYDARDSISNEKVVGEMAEMRADYEVSKKETEIKGLEAVNALRTRINIWLSVGVLLITVLSVFLFRLNKNLKKANRQLSIQKVELEQKNEIIRTSLEEKETLLKEIHHRVKNNLQIISSLLSLQSHTVTNKKVLDAFQESQQRLHSISLIHQKLYQNENLARVNFKDYMEDLVGTIHHTLAATDKKIDYKIISENIELDIDTAVPLGLIVNELATNAYKYAFTHAKDGLLTISLQENGGSRYQLIIKDNGPGIPKNINIFESESLGLRLVSILSRQLQGNLEVTSDNGAAFCLEFADVIQSIS